MHYVSQSKKKDKMPDFLVRFAQVHQSFRLPELRALAAVENLELQVLKYSEYVCLLFTSAASRPVSQRLLLSNFHVF